MASAKEKEPVNHELWLKDEDEKETIASRVKELRKGRQWNQAQLAKQVGVGGDSSGKQRLTIFYSTCTKTII